MTESLKQQMRQQLALATERARKDGFRMGYQAALRDLQELSAQEAQDAGPMESSVAELHEKAAMRPSPASHFSATPHGANAELVAKALQHIAPREARPAEIIGVVREMTGKTLAFSSTRHAIQQLAARNEIEQVGKESVWRWQTTENGDSP
jgi:hypothetical protein